MTELARNAETLFKILKNRQHKYGAEVGVFEGDTSWRLIDMLPSLKCLFCIDIWVYNEDFYNASPNKRGRIATADWDSVQKVFKKNVIDRFPFNVCAMKMPSLSASSLIKDGSLDFVFIDANHSYIWTKEDIEIWTPKIKNGGIIAGDDFVDKPLYGVKQAVRESFKEFKLINKIWYTVK